MSEQSKSVNLEISKLVPFAGHPFKPYGERKLTALADSIRTSGLIEPIVVRPLGDNYEILSGHNRVEAAKIVELIEVPAIVREGLSDDEALIIVTVSTLIQRSFADLAHSERATALSLHYNAVKSQGKHTDLLEALESVLGTDETCGTVYHKLKARDIVGKSYGLSGRLVGQYIRVATLAETLQTRLDNSELSLRAAVELSYLSPDTQFLLETVLSDGGKRIEAKTASELRAAADGGELELGEIRRILGATKLAASQSRRSVKVGGGVIAQYFGTEQSDSEVEKTIADALAAWFKAQEDRSNEEEN
jgi:ParB family chromosome partitioning protein